MMGRASQLVCKQPAALSVHDYLVDTGAFTTQDFDVGYPILDFKNTAEPGGRVRGAQDRKIQCEEIWEKGLTLLDAWGEAAGWEEVAPTSATPYADSIRRYQELRRLIEGQMGQPIPWVFAAPTVGQAAFADDPQTVAQAIRQKVRLAIRALHRLLTAPSTLHDEATSVKASAVGLYWFTWMPEQKAGDDPSPSPLPVPTHVRESLKQYNIEAFADYLAQHGGLGLEKIQAGTAAVLTDASREATALETVVNKQGWCTEQSKVLYAVLRMAGLSAVFVEPRLTVDYYAQKKALADLPSPIPAHVASAVAIKTQSKRGKEEIFVLDMALQMPEADYARPGPLRAPYWILSLRHYWMMDLANMGFDLGKSGVDKAQEIYGHGLWLGQDSTAYHLFRNYGVLLADHSPMTKPDGSPCATSDHCTKQALELNSQDLVIHLNRADDLIGGIRVGKKKQYERALDHLLRALEIDPRYLNTFTALKELLKEAKEEQGGQPRFLRLRTKAVHTISSISTSRPAFKTWCTRWLNGLRALK